ncbi:SatD family protein [Sporomusa termitida]|uniref:SatD family (SatD) n=1 Tax=Sporomusa termitida TaxID=2377 RepID=A0A517DRG0_9FIRM|nr:SatD family protein [Sporomusa termitida]QDR79933.1 SatD family (SatD) [Sporomusa termitida]
MLYCAIIGDMVRSRQITDRQFVQRQFLAMAAEASRLYAPAIESPFTVTIGDEFQVLLKTIDSAPQIVEHVVQTMKPVELVFGLGIGTIHTDINPRLAIGMDGPAFHLAREALTQAKKKKPKIVYRSDAAAIDMVNSLNCFIETCEERRTKRQQAVLQYLQQGYTQAAIAGQLGIRQQSVHDIINAAYVPEIKQAKQAIARYLASIQQTGQLVSRSQ